MNDTSFLQNSLEATRALKAQKALRTWYLRHARALPWRTKPSLYGTWLSEIMLQQTRVETGIPKWHAFLEEFPTVAHLAQAPEAQVMKAWEGLGYYRRARLLHRAAQAIHEAGDFPSSHDAWLALPGIGTYTAAAIASIGLGEAVAAVDGNVQRVVARWAGITLPVDGTNGKQAIQAVADAWLDAEHPGDHNQAVMELGALVCTPRNANCLTCPLASTCVSAGHEELWGELPRKQPKKRPEPWDLTWHVVTSDHHVAVVQRPDHGIWAKMWTFPELEPPKSFASLGLVFEPVVHLLSHRRISASFQAWQAPTLEALESHALKAGGTVMSWDELATHARPRLLTKKWDELCQTLAATKRAEISTFEPWQASTKSSL